MHLTLDNIISAAHCNGSCPSISPDDSRIERNNPWWLEKLLLCQLASAISICQYPTLQKIVKNVIRAGNGCERPNLKLETKKSTDSGKYISDVHLRNKNKPIFLSSSSTAPRLRIMKLPLQFRLQKTEQSKRGYEKISYFSKICYFYFSKCSYCTMLYKNRHSSGLTPPPPAKRVLLYCSKNRTHRSPTCMHLAIDTFKVIEIQFFARKLNSDCFSSPWYTLR